MECDFGYIRRPSTINGDKGLTLFDKDKKWLMKLTAKGIKFNIKSHESDPDDFSRKVVEALANKFAVFIVETVK